MDDMTIVYYTSNQEHPEFEQRVQDRIIRESGGNLPIVSVSQKPIDFGENICVGDVGVSGQNAYRQMLIGVEAAKTKYVVMAEADNLQPPDYFAFRPPVEDKFYAAMPIWVLFAQRGRGHVYATKPRGSESSMVSGRDHLARSLEKMLEGKGMWVEHGETGQEFPYLWHVGGKPEYFTLSAPVITIKTDRQLHRKTPHLTDSYTRELPYWGNSNELLKAYAL